MMTLKEIKGVGDATIKKLNELGIHSVFELLSFLPSKYTDLKQPISILEAVEGQCCLLNGKVISATSPSPRKNRSFSVLFEDTLSTKKTTFKAMFFYQPYLQQTFVEGETFRLFAKISLSKNEFSVVNPVCENIAKISKLEGIFTTYPLRGIIGQSVFKKIIHFALASVNPNTFKDKYAEINKQLFASFNLLHQPKTLEDADYALNQLTIIDLALTLAIHKKTKPNAENTPKLLYSIDKCRVLPFENALPYKLTDTQTTVCNEVINDLTSFKNSSRILTGDVGSGKTVVGFFACYLAFLNGFQSVFMAPTEILARQHAEKFEKLADILGIKFAVLTSSTSAYDRNDIIAKLKTGDISVLFGTQSVIGQEIVYKNLAVAVIDEQHRFGVRERAELEKKGAKYVLSMTATPIPRSLALTFYDDIAISTIKKRENAVTNITTQVVDCENTAKMFKFVANDCKNNNQAFVVCPAILDSEGFDIYSLETLIKEYGKTFDGIKLSVLHGKLTNEQKSSIMADFSSGKTDLLLATTVIEVGIDTKAKNIVIMNADRFGLATLHQLRGRVGRDGSPANCFLHTKSVSEKSLSRLNYVKNTNDGETLAEYDFSLRGAGEILGLKQSGESLTPIFGLKVQLDALKNCKSLADNLMQKYTVRELLALTRGSESKVMAFLEYLRNTTLNS